MYDLDIDWRLEHLQSISDAVFWYRIYTSNYGICSTLKSVMPNHPKTLALKLKRNLEYFAKGTLVLNEKLQPLGNKPETKKIKALEAYNNP